MCYKEPAASGRSDSDLQRGYRRKNVSEVPIVEPTGAYARSPYHLIITIFGRFSRPANAAGEGYWHPQSSPPPKREKAFLPSRKNIVTKDAKKSQDFFPIWIERLA
jgi:hypothetical protein